MDPWRSPLLDFKLCAMPGSRTSAWVCLFEGGLQLWQERDEEGSGLDPGSAGPGVSDHLLRLVVGLCETLWR